jgi:hypothetical protein
MHPKLLLLFMWKVGYFQRNEGVMSLFQVSKELHLNGVDMLKDENVVRKRPMGNQLRLLEAVGEQFFTNSSQVHIFLYVSLQGLNLQSIYDFLSNIDFFVDRILIN